MPPILIVYATREGLTRRVAERVAAAMRGQGREVDVVDAADRSAAAAVDVARYAGAIVAGSVHAGRHEPSSSPSPPPTARRSTACRTPS
ncbi:MAG: flavodoxin domain-containing protein [Anaerolineae bacterium]